MKMALENILQHDEAMQRLTTQHAPVVQGRLLGPEHQDGGEGCDWLKGDWEGGAWLSGTEVGPLSTVDCTHLDVVNLRV